MLAFCFLFRSFSVRVFDSVCSTVRKAGAVFVVVVEVTDVAFNWLCGFVSTVLSAGAVVVDVLVDD